MSMRRVIPIFILILMTAYGPLSMIDDFEDFEDFEVSFAAKSEANVKDVPTWRIGDTWVYETKFDVAGLIQSANVSASIQTLTGDTTMEVTEDGQPLIRDDAIGEIIMKDLEKEAIIRTLRFFNNNRRKTARSLGVSERTLYRKIEDYNLEPKIKRNDK